MTRIMRIKGLLQNVIFMGIVLLLSFSCVKHKSPSALDIPLGTATETATVIFTETATVTNSPTFTATHSFTLTPVFTGTYTYTPTITNTFTASNTWTASNTRTQTPTPTSTLQVTGKIAYQCDSDNQIYIVNANGSGKVKLTNNTDRNFGPALSPDGSKITYLRSNASGVEIYVMNSDGSNDTRITNNSEPEGYLSWTADGNSILYFGMNGINKIDQDGLNHTVIAVPGVIAWYPVMSPDGTKIAFCGDQTSVTPNFSIYIMDSDGSNVVKLHNNTGYDELYPAWSPDGSKIMYSSGESGGGIYIMDPDGTNASKIYAYGGFPQWSPDGSKISFHKTVSAQVYQVFIVNLDGSGLAQITSLYSNSYGSWR